MSSDKCVCLEPVCVYLQGVSIGGMSAVSVCVQGVSMRRCTWIGVCQVQVSTVCVRFKSARCA